jgi:hypothetical protein
MPIVEAPEMTPELERKLERLRHYSTRYEVVGRNGDVTILAGYTSKKTRHGLLGMVRQHGEAWVEYANSTSLQFRGKAADGVQVGEWTITFSGRTQREAYIAGEHPFVLDVLEQRRKEWGKTCR